MMPTVKIAGWDTPLEHALFLTMLQYDTQHAHRLTSAKDPHAQRSLREIVERIAHGRQRSNHKRDHDILFLGDMELTLGGGNLKGTRAVPFVLVDACDYDCTFNEKAPTDGYGLRVRTFGDIESKNGFHLYGLRSRPPSVERTGTGIDGEQWSSVTVYNDSRLLIMKAGFDVVGLADKHTVVSIPKFDSYIDGNKLFWRMLDTALGLRLRIDGKGYRSRAAQERSITLHVPDVSAYDHKLFFEYQNPSTVTGIVDKLPGKKAIDGTSIALMIPRGNVRDVYTALEMVLENAGQMRW